jgi:hypothetical protein
MSILILGSLYFNPEIWLDDAPLDIRQRVGPISERAKRQRRLLGIPTFVFVIGLLIHSIVRLSQANAGILTFEAVFLSTFLIVQVFNVVDLLIIDWLIVATIRPTFIMVPGTEDLKGYSDYGFHFQAFLKGLVGSLIASLVIAALAVTIDVIAF